MPNEDGTLWLTFNGEIYNFQALRADLQERGHKFRSNTDSETILHAYEEWGSACLDRLNGMFAFGLWDEMKGELFLARDRLGVKPLYYWEGPGCFAFASEPKALLDVPGYQRSPDPEAMILYLIYGYIPGERSIWEGIRKLPPGTWLRHRPESGGSCRERYWRLPIGETAEDSPYATQRLETLLADATSRRLVSDVPLGIFLSGGIDSSAVTAFAAEGSSELRTFFVGFDGETGSESEYARIVAHRFNTRHHEESVRIDLAEDLESILRYLDEPLGDSSIIPTYLLCRTTRRHVKVALSGDGGDELFAGYSWYHHYYRLRNIVDQVGPLRAVLSRLAAWKLGIPVIRDHFDVYRGLTSPRFGLREIRSLFPNLPEDAYPKDENEPLQRHYHPQLEPYRSWQYVDASTFLVDDILTKVDRASMANSLEVRNPLLDYRIVEFAFSLAHSKNVHKGTGKHILREAIGDRVPRRVLEKPKRGFSCPVLRYWPATSLESRLRKGRLVSDGVLARMPFEEWLASDRSRHHDAKLWLLALLEIWYESWLAA